MNKLKVISFICFITGIIFFIIGFLLGDVKAGFFIVFPFFAGSGIYSFAGFILIFLAFIFFIFSFPMTSIDKEFSENLSKNKKTTLKGGGVILLGPIPIVFGSSWKITIALMIIAIILIIVTFLSFRFYF
jgi:uncharacterized protein (TIGR00304 family)